MPFQRLKPLGPSGGVWVRTPPRARSDLRKRAPPAPGPPGRGSAAGWGGLGRFQRPGLHPGRRHARPPRPLDSRVQASRQASRPPRAPRPALAPPHLGHPRPRGRRARRVDEDDLVTVHDIAERLDRSRQSVNQLIAGDRGDGTFPQPLGRTRGHGRVWSWSEVAEWAGADFDAETSALLQAVNGALALRRAGRALGDEGLRRLVEVATAA